MQALRSSQTTHGAAWRPVGAATLSAIALVLLSGCDKKAGGQVIAVVNGEEITQPELRAEADAEGVPPDANMQAIAPAILDRVIQRNLLAAYARDQKLDHGPDFIARRRQVEQSLLANMALRKLAADQGRPTTAEVQAFIKQNPATFAQRQRLALDQIRFATPKDVKEIKALDALGSLDAIAAKLTADGVKFARGSTAMDTGAVESPVARQIAALSNDAVFDLSSNGTTFLSAITGRSGTAVPASEWPAQAQAMIQRERAQKSVVDAVTKMRSQAKIDYDPAFRPMTPAKTPSAAPK